jgi:hypothetical protein
MLHARTFWRPLALRLAGVLALVGLGVWLARSDFRMTSLSGPDHPLVDRWDGMILLEVSIVVLVCVAGIRESKWGRRRPKWLGVLSGILLSFPALQAGGLVGAALGAAYGPPGASSSVFAYPSGRIIDEALGRIGGGVCGLVLGLVLRNRLYQTRLAFYAGPVLALLLAGLGWFLPST